ncbi:MAG: aconitate hydratase AcnA [Deltaproteobacteria bacterium]|nr:aconitate hydratase AcnA [Deltaproteobacteria bacterium]
MTKTRLDSFRTRTRLQGTSVDCFSLPALADAGLTQLERLPFSIRVLLENLLRNEDGRLVKADDVRALAAWSGTAAASEVPYMPARVLLQDFTGVPAVCDLAAMREATRRLGGDAKRINPQIPADLVIDHSVQVDRFGSAAAFSENGALEYERNRERYVFLRWGGQSLENFRVVPPETGICHQVNLEYLARVVFTAAEGGATLAYPDTCVGTDSHTTMINGLGVVGWGVGGIEAEAVMLGQPYYMLTPQVVGVKLTGALRPGATATDLVLTVTQLLRKHGVVEKFVEFYGPALASLALADRATIANMAPEYGATIGFFPVDDQTLAYLRLSGRADEQVALVERYCKAQGLFRSADTPDPQFTEQLSLDLDSVEPSLAGPKRPQDRVPLQQMKRTFKDALSSGYKRDVGQVAEIAAPAGAARLPERQDLYAAYAVPVTDAGNQYSLTHGAVVIAAITSCTNTSNPSVMLGAGLLAQKAAQRGLQVKPWVKTSLAPGSKVVTDYLRNAGVLPGLEALRFNVVGYGCTTCIGNSGPLPEAVAKPIKEHNLVAAAVLSGNRNFEGRINPLTLANYLASPPLVVAYALAGTVDIDLAREPLGTGSDGRPVYLQDIWPTPEEVSAAVKKTVTPALFRTQYANVFKGDARWQALPAPAGELYEWEAKSSYIKSPPFFATMTRAATPPTDLVGARVLAVLGDSVTTDHISPAGSIPADSPAGRYLIAEGVAPKDFNSYGARRGNHEVMMRGTFANIRLKNLLVPGVEGGVTRHFPDGAQTSIYEAAMQYQRDGVPLLVIAGKEYGTGSSRDWAAKGTNLLGVRAVIAESYERIHRSNLVGMGVLPLQFLPGESRESLGLQGDETYAIRGLASLSPRQRVRVEVTRADGSQTQFDAVARIDTPVEVDYYGNGGILQTVIRAIAAA